MNNTEPTPNRAWARKQLFGRVIDAWKRDASGNYYLNHQAFNGLHTAEFNHPSDTSTDPRAVALGKVFAELGLTPGQAFFHHGSVVILQSAFEQKIKPRYPMLCDHALNTVDKIYVECARNLLFKEGLQGWQSPKNAADGSQNYYRRDIEMPPNAEGRVFPIAMNHAISKILRDLGIEDSYTSFSKTSIAVFVPQDAFEEKIAPNIGPKDAGKLAAPRISVSKS